MPTAAPLSVASPPRRFHSSSASLLLLALLGSLCLPELAACGGTTPGAPFRRAKLTAADEFDCAPADIREVGGMEWTRGARYALEACGQRHTYECDESTCTRVCDYVPVASSFTGEGPAEGDHGEFVARWAAAEFGCDDVRQVERARSRYTLSVCGQEVVYDCDDDEGCARRCD
ncbi:MAG: hypothetical protein KC593_24480 [Myxococcales bacterium]|nr:hypothetical protein [Myxococcales bacterium]MCB9627191.1 hypothetical protein [Sandaracinaceae bacterium]